MTLHQADHEHVRLLLDLLVEGGGSCTNWDAHVVAGHGFESLIQVLCIHSEDLGLFSYTELCESPGKQTAQGDVSVAEVSDFQVGAGGPFLHVRESAHGGVDILLGHPTLTAPSYGRCDTSSGLYVPKSHFFILKR